MFSTAHHRIARLAAVFAVLAVAAAVRLYQLDRHGYQLDEMWAAEVAVGHGSVHQHLPTNVVTDPPALFKLQNAPAVWRLWSRIDVTHPPLYSIVLRLWENIFGGSDYAGRWLSVVLSVTAVGVLIDTVRRTMGFTVAVWSGLLSAVSGPLVDYGRETRNYALLVLTATLAANALVRIQTLGATRRRSACLAAAVFFTLLSHYFSVGFIAALGIYALVMSRNKTAVPSGSEGPGSPAAGPAVRTNPASASVFAIAAGIALFALLWAPMMWRQRRLFSTADSSTLFLNDDVPGHIAATFRRLLTLPVRLLFEPHAPTIATAVGGAVFFVLPWFLIHRRPGIGLWIAWLTGAAAVPAALDFSRGTAHLFFIRYALLAAPAVCVLWPAVLAAIGRQWVWAVAPVVVACIAALPEVYTTGQADPSEVGTVLSPRWNQKDLLVFAAAPGHQSSAGTQYMMTDRYLRPIPCPVLFLDAPPAGEAAKAVAAARIIWLFSDEPSQRPYLPQTRQVHAWVFPGRGVLFELTMVHAGREGS